MPTTFPRERRPAWAADDGKGWPVTDQPPASGWWLASDGNWYPPAAESTAPAEATQVDAATPTAVPAAEASPVDAATPTAVPAAEASPVDAATPMAVPAAEASPVDAATPMAVPAAEASQVDAATPTAVPAADASHVDAASATVLPSGAPTPPPDALPGGDHPPGWWLASDGNWYPPAGEATAPTDGGATAAATTKSGGTSLKKPLLIMGAGIVAVLVLLAGVLVVRQFRGRLPDNGIPLGVDEVPSSDLALADGAVVVRSDNGNAVREISPDGTRIVLDAKASGLDALQPGNTMVLTGITAVKADQVERNGDTVTITAKAATLTDIIKDGKIHFDHQEADLGKATLRVFAPTPDLVNIEKDIRFTPPAMLPADGFVEQSLSPTTVRQLFVAGEGEHAAGFVDLPVSDGSESAQAAPISREGDLGGFHYQFDARVTGDSISFTLHLTRDENGFRIDINVSADVQGVGFEGDMEISAASVRQFRLDAPNLRGKATITASAAAGPQATRLPVTLMHLPMSMQIPFPIYGIPFTVGLESDAKVELVFSSRDASVSGSFDAHFDGNGGMSVNNGSLTSTGAFNQDWTDPLEAMEGVAITPTSLIVTIQFPKVSLGVGIAIARASAYIETVYAFAPTISGVTNFTPCRAEPVSMVVKAGIAAEFLGHEIGSHEVVIAQRSAAPFDPPVRVCQI
jgi:hypothetical protein